MERLRWWQFVFIVYHFVINIVTSYSFSSISVCSERINPSQKFQEKPVRKISKKTRRKYMCQSLIFNKVAGVYLEKLLKKRLRLELFQNSLFTEHLQESINVLFLTVRQLCVQYRGGLQRRWSMSVVLHHQWKSIQNSRIVSIHFCSCRVSDMQYFLIQFFSILHS